MHPGRRLSNQPSCLAHKRMARLTHAMSHNVVLCNWSILQLGFNRQWHFPFLHIELLMHLMHTGSSPSYFPGLVTATANIPFPKRLRPANTLLLRTFTTRLNFGERCFSHAGAKAWNELPTGHFCLNVRSLQSDSLASDHLGVSHGQIAFAFARIHKHVIIAYYLGRPRRRQRLGSATGSTKHTSYNHLKLCNCHGSRTTSFTFTLWETWCWCWRCNYIFHMLFSQWVKLL